MFERFLDRYPAAGGAPAGLWNAGELLAVEGYGELAGRVAGLLLGGGILRIVSAEEGAGAEAFVTEGFPEFAARAVPVAVDWLGRVFAVDRARAQGLLLVEPGSGEAFEIDESFSQFFDGCLVDEPELLEVELYERWLAAGGVPPQMGACIGFKVPLFLGGAGSVDNLELMDLEVYWSLAAQLRRGTRNLSRGTKIHGVTSDDA